jgi:hypothetical protein
MTHQDNARDYLQLRAPLGWEDLFRRLTWHHRVNWNAPDYITEEEHPDGSDGRATTTELDEVEAISSLYTEQDPWIDFGSLEEVEPEPRHALLIDLDGPAWLIPSSTGGHGHLYAEVPGGIPDDALWRFLDAAVEIGLVEEGYVGACKSRGMTSLRAPWIRKGEEPRPDAPQPVETLDALEGLQ